MHGKTIGEISWIEAQAYANGKPPIVPGDREDYVARKQQELANRLVKSFGKTHADNPEIWAGALQIFNGRLVKWMGEMWFPQDFDDDGNVRPESDF